MTENPKSDLDARIEAAAEKLCNDDLWAYPGALDDMADERADDMLGEMVCREPLPPWSIMPATEPTSGDERNEMQLIDGEQVKTWIVETLVDSGRWDATVLDAKDDDEGWMFLAQTVGHILADHLTYIGTLEEFPNYQERTGVHRNAPLFVFADPPVPRA
jgi:hypothetical protein